MMQNYIWLLILFQIILTIVIKIASVDRIKLMDNKNELFDINKNLSQYSVLITDYSSIYFDFLLTKKPVILAPFDKEF